MIAYECRGLRAMAKEAPSSPVSYVILCYVTPNSVDVLSLTYI